MKIKYIQTFREYPNSIYKVYVNGQKRTEHATLSISWQNNNATTIDNINSVVYPGGWVILKTYFQFLQTIDGGYRQFSARGEDEGGRNVKVVATMYSQSDVGIIVYYSEYLSYSMLFDLLIFKID